MPRRNGNLTRLLYWQGLRPLPAGNSLPPNFPRRVEQTCGRYEGEPREELPLASSNTEQHWVPRWVDIVLELWAGSVALAAGPAEQRQLHQRNLVLQAAFKSPAMQVLIVDAYDRVGLRGAREAVQPVIVGSPPLLIEEVEAMDTMYRLTGKPT